MKIGTLAFVLVAGVLSGAPASAAKMWLPVIETWNVPFDEFIEVCDPVTGACDGTVTGPRGTTDLTDYVWATRIEAINWVVRSTRIPVDLTGTVYLDGQLWYLECDNVEEENCPRSFSRWFYFIDEGNITRNGGSSNSFQGIYRGLDEDGVSTLFGYILGEGVAIFDDSAVDWRQGLECEFHADECWDAYGYWLYKVTAVPEPTSLALLGLGLTGLGLGRRRKGS